MNGAPSAEAVRRAAEVALIALDRLAREDAAKSNPA